MNKIKLMEKWNKEKNSYQNSEIGSGVQTFVKDVLQSEEVFSLKKGLKSTKIEKRSCEFLEEEKTKDKRRADIVIFISSEIIIPVEIEKYQNIKEGEKQIFIYQSDLDKKYGILTDGFTWRFYNNNIFKEFQLTDILEKTGLFSEFWKEYIKPEYYYLSFFEKQQKVLDFPGTETLPVEDNRELFFADITKLIRSFKNKIQLEGYLNELDKKSKEKSAVELTYAYIIQFVLYKTLVDNEFENFKSEFERIVNKIYGYLKEKRFDAILGTIDGISAKISKNIYKPFSDEQKYINEKLLELYRSGENTLNDLSPWLEIFVFIKKYNFANIQNEIFGYIYENYLKELYSEGKKGQYFTDPDIVNFMLDQMGYYAENIEKNYTKDKNSISLIDPACGSGTFLYSAVDQIIKAFGNNDKENSKKIEEVVSNNIFGLDIEEFPLYLAEMGILMKLLPLIINEKYNNPIDKKIKVFLTKDSVAEFTDTALRNTFNDIEVKGGQQRLNFDELDLGYESYVREKNDLREMKESLENVGDIRRLRFDYVIGNPPYVGYNECSKQKVLAFELMKEGKLRLNNIYGVNFHNIPNHHRKYSPKPNLYAFFIALGIALLKDNGKLCFIIPQTILTAGDLDVIRYHLAKFTTIRKIITFSGKMFIGRGLRQNKEVATSSLIFILNKQTPSNLHNVEIINYQKSNENIKEILEDILAGKNVGKKQILQNRLLQNVLNWNFIKQGEKFLDFYEAYQKNSEDISIYYEHSLAESKFGSRFYFDVGFDLNDDEILELGNINNSYEVLDFNSFFGYSRFVPNEYYPKDKNKIGLTQNNQGYVTLEQKYKIIWRIKNPNRFYYTDHSIIFKMGKASIICSNNKEETLYLLSILNFPLTNLVLEAQIKNEQEKEYQVPIKAIKNFVRVPRIDLDNQKIKNEIIKQTKKMLDLEGKTLSDFVNFSKIMVQKFDEVSVNDTNLLLEHDNKIKTLAIKKNANLVKKIVDEKYNEIENPKISLSDLRKLPIIDYDKQNKLKDYIDDLVFALYFNIDLTQLKSSEEIKNKCKQNKYYEWLQKERKY